MRLSRINNPGMVKKIRLIVNYLAGNMIVSKEALFFYPHYFPVYPHFYKNRKLIFQI